ncbi:hypothetical protein PIB30_115522, partial [Stylosanthes scabra]|nr:hypothetical protein [Stylosanthes scabra]
MGGGWVATLRRQRLRLLLPSRRRPGTLMQCFDGANNVGGMRCGRAQTRRCGGIVSEDDGERL